VIWRYWFNFNFVVERSDIFDLSRMVFILCVDRHDHGLYGVAYVRSGCSGYCW